MAKKERQRRSARQARQRERVAREAQEAAATSDESKGSKRVAASEGKSLAAGSAKGGKEAPRRKGRIRTYLGAVGSELRRVSWPSRSELTNYSVAVIVALVVVGAVVWLVDTGFLNLMFQFTKLRG